MNRKMLVHACVSANLFLAACTGSSGQSAEPTTPRADAVAPAWLRMQDDPLAARMRTLQARLLPFGFRPGVEEARGFLVGGENLTVPVHVPANTCAVLTSVTSPGIRDLDATMFSPEGELLTEDVEEDAHPTTIICATETERHIYVALRAYDGAGAYLTALFLGPASHVQDAARAVGGQPGIAGNSVADVEQNAHEREFGIGEGRHGLTPARATIEVTLAMTQVVRVPLQVESGHCYAVAGFAASGLANLDLRIVDSADHEVVRDAGTQQDAAVHFCADHAEEFGIELIATSGAGVARVAIYSGQAAHAGGLSTSWLGTSAASTRNGSTADEALNPTLAQLVQRGYRIAWRAAARPVETGGSWEGQLNVPAHSCTAVVAGSGRGLGRVAIVARALNDARSTTAHTPAGTSTCTLHVCADATAKQVDVLVSAENGQGELSVAYVAAPDRVRDELSRGL